MFDSDKLLILNEEQLLRLKPLGKRILIDWETTPERYGKSSLIRPEQYRQAHFTGIVISIGDRVREVEKGDRIFFDQFWGGEKFYFENKRYAFVNEWDVLAKIPQRDVSWMDEQVKIK